ncbi:hypothetical protein F5141DRAFT_1064219 [Pisolithus sp. B1]|nr:hypothetical protein F5141DRAFT_1064219 [Pisolithus sp. B1]
MTPHRAGVFAQGKPEILLRRDAMKVTCVGKQTVTVKEASRSHRDLRSEKGKVKVETHTVHGLAPEARQRSDETSPGRGIGDDNSSDGGENRQEGTTCDVTMQSPQYHAEFQQMRGARIFPIAHEYFQWLPMGDQIDEWMEENVSAYMIVARSAAGQTYGVKYIMEFQLTDVHFATCIKWKTYLYLPAAVHPPPVKSEPPGQKHTYEGGSPRVFPREVHEIQTFDPPIPAFHFVLNQISTVVIPQGGSSAAVPMSPKHRLRKDESLTPHPC